MANNAVEDEESLNPRSCIVTRKKADRGELIRFVADPEGKVVPDLKGNLPGRGVWVTPNRNIVAQAIAKDLFSRGLKQKVRADETLLALTEKLLRERALSALSMTKKAGLLVAGFDKVDRAVRSGKVDLLLHATDASADGKRKLASAVSFVDHMGGDEIEVAEIWTVDEMSNALGIGNAVHLAALYGGATRNLQLAICQLSAYMEGAQMQSPDRK